MPEQTGKDGGGLVTPSKNARMRDEIMELLEVADLPMAYADDVKDLLDHYYPEPEQPPEWAKDCLNDDAVCRCGGCGGWMTAVRPGKHQCDNPRCPEPEQTPATLGFDRERLLRSLTCLPLVVDEEVHDDLIPQVRSLLASWDALRAKLVEADTNHAETYRKWTEQKARADALEQERDRIRRDVEALREKGKLREVKDEPLGGKAFAAGYESGWLNMADALLAIIDKEGASDA